MTNRLAIVSMVLALAVAGAGGCATRDAARHPAPGSPADPGASPGADSVPARRADGDGPPHDPTPGVHHGHQHPSPPAPGGPGGGHEHHDQGGSHAH